LETQDGTVRVIDFMPLRARTHPVTRRQLGNTPQAFSHFALVVSAVQPHMRGPARNDNPMAR